MNLVGEGCMFENYKQMHEVVIGNWDALKKSLKSDPYRGQNIFKEKILETQGTTPWTRQENCENSMDLLGAFNVLDVVSQDVLDHMASKNIISLSELKDGSKDVCWFIPVKTVPKMTKNKKPYLLIEAIGLDGVRKRMFMWGWKGQEIPLYSLCAAEVSSNNFGMSCKQYKFKIIL